MRVTIVVTDDSRILVSDPLVEALRIAVSRLGCGTTSTLLTTTTTTTTTAKSAKFLMQYLATVSSPRDDDLQNTPLLAFMANEYLVSLGESTIQVDSSVVEVVATATTGAGIGSGATIGIVLGGMGALSGAASVFYIRRKKSVRSRLRAIGDNDHGTFEPEGVVTPSASNHLNSEDVLGYLDILKKLETEIDYDDDDDDLAAPVAPVAELRPASSYYLDAWMKRQVSQKEKVPQIPGFGSAMDQDNHQWMMDSARSDSNILSPDQSTMMSPFSSFFTSPAAVTNVKAPSAPVERDTDEHVGKVRRVYAAQNDGALDVDLEATKAPVTLKKKQSTFHLEARRVFSLLDGDNDGFVTDKEISSFMNISTREAVALITEAKIQLYGAATRGNLKLTFEEFTSVLASKDEEEKIENIPGRVIKRYRNVFDSIDVEHKGVITPTQLAGDMGISNLEELGFQGKNVLTFEDFVKILRRAETGRAGRMMTKLLEDQEQGQKLASATQEKKAPVIAVGAGRLALPLAELKSLPRDGSVLDDIWYDAKPQGNVANVENVKAALLTATSENTIRISDDDLMQVIFNLAGKTDGAQNVSYNAFLLELRPLVDTGSGGEFMDSEDESPRLKSSGIIPNASDDEDDEWGSPSVLLSDMEFDECRLAFEENDRDGDGLVTSADLKDVFMSLIGRPMIQPTARIFYMQALKMLDETEGEVLDFDQFANMIRAASDETGDEFAGSDWDFLTALSALRLQQKRSKSRLSFKMTRSKNKASASFGKSNVSGAVQSK